MNETTLLQQIRLALGSIPGVVLWRNSTGFDKRTNVRYGLCVGSSDLIGFTVRDGLALFTAIEVKAPGARRSPEQEQFIAAIKANGGLAGFAESIEDAKGIIYGVSGDRIG